MRTITLLAAACALAATNVVAMGEAQQSTVHLRVQTEDEAEIPNAAVVGTAGASAEDEEEGTAQEVSTQKHHQRGHHQLERAARACRKLRDEWFRDQIVTACGTNDRKGTKQTSFYYLLKNGKIMRNCNCDDFFGGLTWRGTDGKEQTPGEVSGISLDFRCYSKTTKSWRESIAPFNKDHVKCVPGDFTNTPL